MKTSTERAQGRMKLPGDYQQPKFEDYYPPEAAAGGFKVPADAPPAPREDGHKLKANGQVIAISKGGQWTAP
jgi:hypothetical protein